MTTQTRQEEIKAIHIKYEDFYKIGGGLFAILVLIMIGSWIFGQNAFDFEGDFLGYITNVATEALSVVGTVIVVDQLNRYRNREERKQELFGQAKSRSNDMAIDAVEKIQRAGWWEELLQCYLDKDEQIDLSLVQWTGCVSLKEANLEEANLEGANLQKANLGGANLQKANLYVANLQEANLRKANLHGAKLWEANLEEANLEGANLQEASLGRSNLQEAYLRGANLEEAYLGYANFQDATLFEANLEKADLEWANLQGATLFEANLEKADLRWAYLYKASLAGINLRDANLVGVDLADTTWQGRDFRGRDLMAILPDGMQWTPETDMTRYTDPNHPDFWQPDWVKEQEDDATD